MSRLLIIATAAVAAIATAGLAVVVTSPKASPATPKPKAVQPASVSPPKPMPAASAGPSKLAQIFNGDMLGADVGYLQNITGTPWKTFNDERTYKVAGCIVTATVVDASVRSLGLDLSDQCGIDLTAFNPNWKAQTKRLTFGLFEKNVGSGRFYADCLSQCGNAYDPSVYEHYKGSHAENFVEVVLGVQQVDDKSLAAADAWEDAMKAAQGEDYVIDQKFNCEPKFNEAASKAFTNVRPTSIKIGFDLEPASCSN